MSQQFKNGGGHDGSRTVTYRDSYKYAAVNRPGEGVWRKTPEEAQRRHQRNIRLRMARMTRTRI